MGKKRLKRRKVKPLHKEGMTREESKQKNNQAWEDIINKRKRFVMVGACAAVLVVVLLIMSMMGVFAKKASTTTLTLMSDGKVVFEEVMDNEADLSASDVKKYAKETIEAYNSDNGSDSIILNKVSDKGDKIYLKTTYKDAKTYADFTAHEFFAGTIEEAQEKGYVFDGTFSSVSSKKKGKTVKLEKVTEDTSANVIVVDQSISVVVPESIKYVSETSTEVTDKTVKISDDVTTFIIY